MNFKIKVLCQALICLALFHSSSSLMEWLFGSGEEAEATLQENEGEGTIRFEVLSSDEKFLDFARTLNDLSPLDACYNIVIYSLRKKCGELTEEELGKLSVQLLNCQSEAEDRPVFACTKSMSLSDCTKSMDGTTWNSYQIVGNRARAMCYATQQLQFRRLTEVTVNKLVSLTSDQVKSLRQIKAGQDALHSLTSDTVQFVQDSQKDLLMSQQRLKEGHQDMLMHIAGNMKDILQEKALIATGNRELAAMTEDIRHRLDATAKQIQDREEVEHKKHERILQDLRDIQDNTETSVKKLDANLQRLTGQFQALDTQYTFMRQHLTKMNVSLTYLQTAITFMQTHLDERINWLSQLLGGADNKLAAMSCCLLHIAYFFLVAVVATFLQMSLAVRLTFLTIIVGNVAAELNYQNSLDFAGLTVFLFTVYFGFKLTLYLARKFSPHSSTSPSSRLMRAIGCGESGLSQDDVDTLIHLLQKLSNSMSQGHADPRTTVPNGTVLADVTPPTPPSAASIFRDRDINNSSLGLGVDAGETTRRLLDTLGDRGSVSSSRASTPVPRGSRSSTPSVSSRCLSQTMAGTQCRLPASAGSDYCRVHTPR